MLIFCSLSNSILSTSSAVAAASACVFVRGSVLGAMSVPLTASRRKGRLADWMREMSSCSMAASGVEARDVSYGGKVSARDASEICE